MYLSGFSGGSRLACAIASVSDLFTGVIACGAGFPQIPEYIPSSQNYAYVGLCGNRDFNYHEMLENKTYLDKLDFNHTLITSKGKHSWPNENEIISAFDWLYLQNLRKTNSQVDQKKILELYESDYSVTVNHKNNMELILAAENYQRFIESYTPFLELDSITIQYKELIKSKDYKKQVKSLSKAFKAETEIANKLLTRFDLDLKGLNHSDLAWWKKQLKELEKMKDSENLEIKNMAFRVKFNAYVTIFSTKKNLLIGCK